MAGPDASELQQQFWVPALAALRDGLKRLGSDLLILYGELPDAFGELKSRLPFEAVCAEEETGLAHTFARDRRVRRWCRETGISLVETPRNGVIRGLTDRDNRMQIWKTRVLSAPLAEPPRVFSSSEVLRRAGASELPKPSVSSGVQPCTENDAWETLRSFLAVRAAT